MCTVLLSSSSSSFSFFVFVLSLFNFLFYLLLVSNAHDQVLNLLPLWENTNGSVKYRIQMNQ